MGRNSLTPSPPGERRNGYVWVSYELVTQADRVVALFAQVVDIYYCVTRVGQHAVYRSVGESSCRSNDREVFALELSSGVLVFLSANLGDNVLPFRGHAFLDKLGEGILCRVARVVGPLES